MTVIGATSNMCSPAHSNAAPLTWCGITPPAPDSPGVTRPPDPPSSPVRL
jgi:hypothetical protein